MGEYLVRRGCTRYRTPMAAGAYWTASPYFYVVEFYVTAFDRLVWDSPEQSVVSELFAGKMIGFAMTLQDSDTVPSMPDRIHDLFGPDASWDRSLIRTSDRWAQWHSPGRRRWHRRHRCRKHHLGPHQGQPVGNSNPVPGDSGKKSSLLSHRSSIQPHIFEVKASRPGCLVLSHHKPHPMDGMKK